jgi:UDP-4-amino-4,6-dideoxy-N-acetyl-beta-L-altrosamine transaminase
MTTDFLPYGRQTIDDDDIAAVVEVLKSDWLTTGPAVTTFEGALAERVGAQQVAACSNGTAALHLAMIGLGVEPGQRVAVPANTFLATANAVRFVGAEVLFVDVDPGTGLMTAETLRAALETTEDHVVGVIPVHFAGQAADPEGIRDVARRAGMFVVEDAAHAIGTVYQDGAGTEHAVGSCAHSDIATFSFHPVKTITMGEGGAVATNDSDLHRRMAAARNHNMIGASGWLQDPDLAMDKSGQPNPWYYEMTEPGYNYRATDIQCALGLSQLAKLDIFIEKRRLLAERYDRLLKGLAPGIRPLARVDWCRPAWHLYVVLVDFDEIGVGRGELMRQLKTQGIGTQVHYRPVSDQPYYKTRYGAADLQGAAEYYNRALSLPLYPGMSLHDVDRVVEGLDGAIRRRAVA